MCRSLISVDWQGYVYDCDFNQMLDLPLRDRGRERIHLSDLLDNDLTGVRSASPDIATAAPPAKARAAAAR